MQVASPVAPRLETTLQEILRDPPESLAAALEARGHTPEDLEAYARDADAPDHQEALRQVMLRAASSSAPEDARLAAHLQSLLDPRERAWNRIIRAHQTGETLSAMVVEAVRGGVVVDLGVRGFIPASHAGLGQKVNLQALVGRTLPLRVIEVNRRRQMVVLSHRKVLEEERAVRRRETLHALKAGEVREGVVRRLSEIGAFVDVGGVDGLLHVSELAWTPVQNPADVLKVGQKIEVLVQRVDPEAGRISLSMKRLTPDPWAEARKQFNPGASVRARVTQLVSGGAVVDVAGHEAFIPMRELSPRRIQRPDEAVQLGQEVEAVVLEVRDRDRRIILSLREAVEQRERQDYQSFQRRQQRDDGRTTLGDLFGHLFADQIAEARRAEENERSDASRAAAPPPAETAPATDELETGEATDAVAAQLPVDAAAPAAVEEAPTASEPPVEPEASAPPVEADEVVEPPQGESDRTPAAIGETVEAEPSDTPVAAADDEREVEPEAGATGEKAA